MDHSDDRAFGRTPDAMDETIVDETLGVENRDDNDMPRVADDTDLEPQGSGREATPGGASTVAWRSAATWRVCSKP